MGEPSGWPAQGSSLAVVVPLGVDHPPCKEGVLKTLWGILLQFPSPLLTTRDPLDKVAP